MATLNHSLGDFLQETRILVGNSQNLPEVAGPLAEFGYNSERWTEGVGLLQAAETLVLAQKKEYGEQYEASEAAQAAWAVADAGARAAGLAAARRLEYPVWLWHDPADRPAAGEVRVHRVDVGRDLALKRRAIRAHRSQTTASIADDPTAFRLSNAMQANFHRASELYFEPVADRSVEGTR